MAPPLDSGLVEVIILGCAISETRGGLAMRRLSIAAAAGALSCALIPGLARAQSDAPELPDGAGKEVVETVCTTCHQTNQITRSSGYTRAGWQERSAPCSTCPAAPRNGTGSPGIWRRISPRTTDGRQS
jgi:hypothetical protein